MKTLVFLVDLSVGLNRLNHMFIYFFFAPQTDVPPGETVIDINMQHSYTQVVVLCLASCETLVRASMGANATQGTI